MYKVAMATDIHFGKRNNSEVHNQDNLNFIDFFIDRCLKERPNAIAFLGDWYENRSAINISTMEYSYKALKKLDELGIPIYFCVGNHDLYKRNSREIHSVNIFQEFKNIILINEPQIHKLNGVKCMFSPFLFHEEYKSLSKFTDCKYWFGHFEFKNFVLTGSGNIKLEHGPDHKSFKEVTHIFSGHFHKRQTQDNVTYIGNPFQTDFGDHDDFERGMAILDVDSNDLKFYNWDVMPSFKYCKLSDILLDKIKLRDNVNLEVTVDLDVTYSEVQTLKEEINKKAVIRQLILLDKKKISDVQALTEEEEVELNETTNETVIKSLGNIDQIQGIDNSHLVSIYRKL